MTRTTTLEPPTAVGTLTLDLVVPVYNEAHVLADSISRLHAFLGEQFPFSWRLTIADNASTDATLALAQQLAAAHPDEVRVLHLDDKGRGRACGRRGRPARRRCWPTSTSTSRRTSPGCCPSWRRCCRATRTW